MTVLDAVDGLARRERVQGGEDAAEVEIGEGRFAENRHLFAARRGARRVGFGGIEHQAGAARRGDQELIPSHRKLLWSKAMVVSVAEKSGQ